MIESLIKFGCQMVANMVKGKTVRNIKMGVWLESEMGGDRDDE